MDELTESKGIGGESRKAARTPGGDIAHGVETRTGADAIPSGLLRLLDKIPNLVAMADANGALSYLNPAGRALLGLRSQDDITGMSLSGCHAAAMRERLGKVAIPHAEGNGVWSGDSVLLTRDGREIDTFLTLVAHRDHRGKLEGFSLLERDMTGWMRREEARRAARAEAQRLSAQHLAIQESERQRIAGDLHDGIGQSLCVLKLSIEQTARSLGATMSESAARTFEQLVPKVKSALAETRRISMNLRPSIIDDLGIIPALSWYFREFEASGVDTRIEREIDVVEDDVPPPLRIVIFRILQEAIDQAVKYAGAGRIRVGLRKASDLIELTIEDDGAGSEAAGDAGDGALNNGLGLRSMRERAELSGGTYVMESAAEKGTRVCVRWPRARTTGGDSAPAQAMPHAI